MTLALPIYAVLSSTAIVLFCWIGWARNRARTDERAAAASLTGLPRIDLAGGPKRKDS